MIGTLHGLRVIVNPLIVEVKIQHDLVQKLRAASQTATPQADAALMRQCLETIEYTIRDLEMRAEDGVVPVGHGVYLQLHDRRDALRTRLDSQGEQV